MAATLLPALTGPYAVGARRLFLNDPRKDPFTNVAPRKISVTAWYPTSSTGPVARYLSAVDAYLLNQLTALPNGIGANADVDRVAVVGHSYGGTTGMEAAYLEPQRIKAVAILDGPVGYPGTSNNAQNNGIAQPVMLLSGPVNPSDGYTTGAETVGWDTYVATSHGPLHRYQVAGARHYAFTDIGLLTTAPATLLGTIPAARAMELHPRWVRAFLDTYVRGVTDPLLTLPQLDWPEVTAL